MARKLSGRFYRELDWRRAFIAAAPLCLAAAASQELSATTYSATDVASLRTAIDSANAPGSDDIVELASGTYTLTGGAMENANVSGDLDITKPSGNLIIRPATGATVTINGNTNDRVFHINAGSGVTVTIEDIAIVDGLVADDGSSASEARGGGILLEQGNLALNNVTVQSCSAVGTPGSSGAPGSNGSNGAAGLGGGIYVAGGSVTLDSCTLYQCAAEGGSGGVGGFGSSSNGGDGGDGAAGLGGGMYVAGGTVNIRTCTFDQTRVAGGDGGDGGDAFSGDCGIGGTAGDARGGGL